MALYSEKTKEAAPKEEPKQEEKPAAETKQQLIYPPGPSQEQLDAPPIESQSLPDYILAALRGEESVVSLPLEVQGGDSLNPPTYDAPADEEADTES